MAALDHSLTRYRASRHGRAAVCCRLCLAAILPFFLFFLGASCLRADSFINFESPHIHPMDLSPERRRLAVCNTADARLEVFELREGRPIPLASIPVGLDPVSVRFRNENEVWVINHISDSISIVEVNQRSVVRTVPTPDEPADVVFAGTPLRAFVSCSQADRLLVLDPAAPDRAPVQVPLRGQRPRALAVSPDLQYVHVALFESGNGTTLLGGGSEAGFTRPFPPNVVDSRRGPYGALAQPNPPPNDGAGFRPALNPENPPPPRSGLIVRRTADGRWLDDNAGDWTPFVSGDQAPASGRVKGWDLIDHELATVRTDTLEVHYAGGTMNLGMALAVNPATARITLIGTDAHNEIRFEPNLNGRFLRVYLAMFDLASGAPARVVDLNPHLDYRLSTADPEVRSRSVGDVRGITWTRDGKLGLITAMGSDSVLFVDADGRRIQPGPIAVGQGPTGIVLDDGRRLAYVLNRFDASISTVSLDAASELARTSYPDSTPAVINRGRGHLYNTRRGSGLGHIACGSCHVDARIDRLAWDLGDPAGAMRSPEGNNLGAGVTGLREGFERVHPMKGPMLTQTLQDIIGKEPFHWRGDRKGLEEFNDTFVSLQGAAAPLSPTELDELKQFLQSLHFPPNPYRALDGSLPSRLPLPDHRSAGRFGPAGRPLPPGNPRAGRALFLDLERRIDRGAFACASCHTLPTGLGTDATWSPRGGAGLSPGFQAIPAGPSGEHHHALVGINFSVQHGFKVPQLRNLHKRIGCDFTQTNSLAGFGFLHDGGVDSLTRFIELDTFDVSNETEVADLVAFLLAFAGSEAADPPSATSNDPLLPPGSPGQQAHPAVGRQITLRPGERGDRTQIQALLALAERGAVECVVHATVAGEPQAWLQLSGPDPRFVPDNAGEVRSLAVLLEEDTATAPVTFTLVPKGTGGRFLFRGAPSSESHPTRPVRALAARARSPVPDAIPILELSWNLVPGEPLRPLETSTNLIDWTPVNHGQLSPGSHAWQGRWTSPADSGSRFFRVPPLIP